MKRTLNSLSFLLAGMIILTACADEKAGESPKQIAEKIEIDVQEDVEDTALMDSIPVLEPIVIPKAARPIPEPTPIGPIDPIEPEPYPPGPNPPNPPIPPQLTRQQLIGIDFPEIDPSFPGGAAEIMKFINESIQYPEISKELGDQGRVYVEFIVEIDGSLTDVRVLRSLTPELDREAKRVIRSMPKWIPGEIRGEKVRSRARLPVTFTLN